MLADAQIASMRATIERTLVDTALIERKMTANVGGEEVETWNPLYELPCRIAPVERTRSGGETGVTGGRAAEETTHTITLAANTDVEEADRLTVNGVTFEALLVRKRGRWELSRRVEAKEAV